LAEEQLQLLQSACAKGGRFGRRLGEVLAGRLPADAALVRRWPVEPGVKRVVVAAAAKRHPEQAKDLLALARQLNFQRDPTALCLNKVLE
jgi:hypothetical protein